MRLRSLQAQSEFVAHSATDSDLNHRKQAQTRVHCPFSTRLRSRSSAPLLDPISVSFVFLTKPRLHTAPRLTMAARTFDLPIVGSPIKESLPAEPVEANNTPAAETTTLLVRVVENLSMVTDPISLAACRSRSMKKLIEKFDEKLKKVNYRTWEAVHGKYAEDAHPTVLFLQKTVGRGTRLWIEAYWDRPGTYASWFERNINSGQNSGSSVKIEIHVSTNGGAEYLGRIDNPTEEELEQERLQEQEEEKIPATMRGYQRFTYSFEQSDLISLEREEEGMLLPPMSARARRLRYVPKEREYDPGSNGWFKGETDAEENHFYGEDGDEEDEEDEDEDDDGEGDLVMDEEVEDEEEEEEDAMDIDG